MIEPLLTAAIDAAAAQTQTTGISSSATIIDELIARAVRAPDARRGRWARPDRRLPDPAAVAALRRRQRRPGQAPRHRTTMRLAAQRGGPADPGCRPRKVPPQLLTAFRERWAPAYAARDLWKRTVRANYPPSRAERKPPASPHARLRGRARPRPRPALIIATAQAHAGARRHHREHRAADHPAVAAPAPTSSLNWVISFYALAFGELLLVGGRLRRPVRAAARVPHRDRGVSPARRWLAGSPRMRRC